MKIGYKINGKSVTRAEFMRGRKKVKPGAPMINHAYAKPLVGIAAGCHPDQVQEFNADLERAGIQGARYLPDGRVEYSARSARRAHARFRGLVDLDGGYGDG